MTKRSSGKITRRAALTSGIAAGAASCAASPKMTPYTAITERAEGAFAHGVASGDPGPDSVVIWTRFSFPDDMIRLSENKIVADVSWECARDEDFANVVKAGQARVSRRTDYTMKVVVDGLQPGSTYYYRFSFGDAYSPVGRTRTLPAGAVSNARFAIVSCSNYPFGYFNVYDLIARDDDSTPSSISAIISTNMAATAMAARPARRSVANTSRRTKR